MRHSDNKEGEEEGRGEEGGCGSGSGVEVGGHGKRRSWGQAEGVASAVLLFSCKLRT